MRIRGFALVQHEHIASTSTVQVMMMISSGITHYPAGTVFTQGHRGRAANTRNGAEAGRSRGRSPCILRTVHALLHTLLPNAQ